MKLSLESSRTERNNYHFPTGILMGPLDDSRTDIGQCLILMLSTYEHLHDLESCSGGNTYIKSKSGHTPVQTYETSPQNLS